MQIGAIQRETAAECFRERLALAADKEAFAVIKDGSRLKSIPIKNKTEIVEVPVIVEDQFIENEYISQVCVQIYTGICQSKIQNEFNRFIIIHHLCNGC